MPRGGYHPRRIWYFIIRDLIGRWQAYKTRRREEFIGRGGIAVPPEDVRRLATALLAILSDSEKRRKMGAAARRIAERFTWESCVERTEKVYLKALATGTRR